MTHKTDCRVVIADDNQDAADTLAMVLEAQGFSVSTAYHGREALDLVNRVQPDVAILDIGMPGVSGYDVARALRQAGSVTLLVAVTGWGSAQDVQRASGAGFDHHFTKPADPKLLISLIEARCLT
ncbi:MAG TPA: response regulator [Usitatibacter sp.]|jgi:DNA-binding response OmpR family regulator|nr:response regulator [Usitatibacter sp.]